MNAPCVSARVPASAEMLDVSPATMWGKYIKEERIAYFRDDGITRVIVDWIGEPPPREGRAPSIKEYIAERIEATKAQPKRIIRNAPRRGRPRKQPAEVV
jgi:hypothetical protein